MSLVLEAGGSGARGGGSEMGTSGLQSCPNRPLPAKPCPLQLIRLRSQLLRDPTVTFGGYRNPHPLEPQIELRVSGEPLSFLPSLAIHLQVQTVPTISPHLAVHNALSALQNETGSLLSQFRAKIETKSAVAS